MYPLMTGACMSDDDIQNSERELRDRIGKRMQSIGQSSPKQIAPEQLQKLKTAATRLDQLLQSNANHDNESLKNAAQKLDQLLSKIIKGKDVTQELKRRRESQSGGE